jgi:hypothetical protein
VYYYRRRAPAALASSGEKNEFTKNSPTFRHWPHDPGKSAAQLDNGNRKR